MSVLLDLPLAASPNMFGTTAESNGFFAAAVGCATAAATAAATGRNLTARCHSPKGATRATRSALCVETNSPPVQESNITVCQATMVKSSHSVFSSKLPHPSSASVQANRSVTSLVTETTKLKIGTKSNTACPALKKNLSQGCSQTDSGPGKIQKEAHGMSPEELAARLNSDPNSVMTLDCRSFIAYNICHVPGALSVCCSNKLTLKRLQCGKLKLSDIVSGDEGKEEYSTKKGHTDIVVYDDTTSDFNCLTPSSPLRLVIDTLHKEGEEVFVLIGGLKAFHEKFSHLCAKPDNKPPPKLLYSPTTPIIDDQIDTAVVAKILPFLYIGNERDAANLDRLRELGITHVLNVTSGIPLHFEDQGIICKRLPASDSGFQNLKQYFTDAFAFIEEVRMSKGKVLIHCQAGVSRSATITIAYIMKHSQMKMIDTFRFVKAKRPIIAPNFNFMGQLLELEQQLDDGRVSRDLSSPLVLDSNNLL